MLTVWVSILIPSFHFLQLSELGSNHHQMSRPYDGNSLSVTFTSDNLHHMPNYFILLSAITFFYDPGLEPKFQAQVLDNNISIGYGLAIGNVDGDGKPDILLADKKQFVWYRNGDWKRFVMVENLTESDNVCIAARDIDGDGMVEVAVGAQWNPSETTDTLKSGSVHFLLRPSDPTQLWIPIELHHEPTIHRMKWIKAGAGYQLIVVPLHGRGNKGGEGMGVKVVAYEMPNDPRKKWKQWTIDQSMHLTHNLDVVSLSNRELLYIGGKEGVKILSYDEGKWSAQAGSEWAVQGRSFGEVRISDQVITGIEPMHGNQLTIYTGKENLTRTVLTSELNQGHALALADLLGSGSKQIIVGWREPDKDKKTGIKMFIPPTAQTAGWSEAWIDDNGIACEDLQLADLDGDGRMEIIAAGRASHNLKVYWNRNGK